MKQFYNFKSKTSVIAALAFGMLGTSAFGQLYPFTDHTFTNAGATGQDGPILSACQSAYTAEVWELNPAWFSMDTQGIQKWTVPATGDYEIEVAGAKGGDDTWASETGGLGTTMTGTFSLTEGDILYIMVGQAGEDTRISVDNAAAGGGGGTFVWDPGDLSAPLMAGGGGGGANGHAFAGRQSTDGMDGNDSYSVSNGGIGGNGGRSNAGGSSYWAGGGAGWLTDGTAGNNAVNYDFDGASAYGKADGGRKPLNGGQGGKRYNDGFDEGGDGGFGGGGGGGSDNMGTGGGGGYSGGGGERGFQYAGGGGGSFNAGIDQVNVAANNEGHGYVTITILCNPLTITIPVTGVCIGDDLTISASSTTGGTVTWDGGVDDGVAFAPVLGTTTYTASSTSTDDCPFSVDISASEIPTIEAFSSVPAACEGALITLWGEGGDMYTWTGDGDVTPVDSVSFLAEDGTTTYTVIGSVLGCEGPAVDLVLVGAPQPDVSAIATPIELCYGDSYVLTGEGAAAYDWGGSIADGDEIFSETPGTFIHTVVGVSGDGCYDTAMVTVNVYEIPAVTGGLDITVCEGDEVTLTGSGADSYIWTPSATDGVPFIADAGTTTYTVTGSNADGCEDTDEVVVTGVELPQVTSSVITPEAFGYDGEIDITVSGGSGSYLYSWVHGPITEDVDGLTSGTYTVTIDDATIHPGMCPTTQSFTMTSVVGIEDESIVNFTAYPNPTTDELTITYNGQFNYKVTTLLGQVVMTGSSTDTENISLKSFANGTYIVEVTANDVVNTIQIVKQ